MSEVNALQLRITDNATDAAKSLDRLATSLRSIRSALTGNKSDLTTTANYLGKFSTALAQSTSADKVNKINAIAGALHKLANATERLKGAGVGFQQAMKAVDKVKANVSARMPSAREARDAGMSTAASAIDAGRGSVSSAVQQTKEIAKNLETAKVTASEIKISVLPPKERKALSEAERQLRRIEIIRNNIARNNRLFQERKAPLGTPENGMVGAAEALARRGFVLPNSTAKGASGKGEIERASSKIEAMRESVRGLAQEEEKAANASTRFGDALKTAKDGLQKLKGAIFATNSSLADLANRLVSVAKYRILRTVIREISEGFRTGLDNVREYGKAVNSLYAKDMAGMDNSLLKMKNSLGAALAPAIRMVIPLIQQLVSWVITAVNYVNQFFALLAGQVTWTRAKDVVADTGDAVEKTGKQAAGAASSVNHLLAAWDELNIIESKSGGGGGGIGGVTEDTAKDFLNMFEEVDVFDGKVRDFVNWLKENLPIVDGLLAGIVARLLGFSLPVATLVAGFVISYKTGYAAGLNGESFGKAVVDSALGLIATALGAGTVAFLLSGNLVIAAIAAAVGLAVSLAVTYAGWAAGSRERLEKELYGDIHATQEELRNGMSFYIPVGVQAQVNNMAEAVGNVRRARDEVQAKYGAMIGDYEVLIGVGIEKATPEKVNTLKTEVEEYINSVNKVLQESENVIKLNIALFGSSEDSSTIISGINFERDVISGIGAQIGRILSDGVVDEFETDLLQKLMNSMRRINEIIMTSQISGDVTLQAGELHENFINGNLDKESVRGYISAYDTLREEQAAKIKSGVQEEWKSALGTVKLVEDVLSNPDAYDIETVRTVTAFSSTEDYTRLKGIASDTGWVEREVERRVGSIFGEADRTVRRDIAHAYSTVIGNAASREGAVEDRINDWAGMDEYREAYRTLFYETNPRDFIEQFVGGFIYGKNYANLSATDITRSGKTALEYAAENPQLREMVYEMLMRVLGVDNAEAQRIFAEAVGSTMFGLNTNSFSDNTATGAFMDAIMNIVMTRTGAPTWDPDAEEWTFGRTAIPNMRMAGISAPAYTDEGDKDGASGAKQDEQTTVLREISAGLTTLNNKQFTVVLQPSASGGRTFSESIRLASALNG